MSKHRTQLILEDWQYDALRHQAAQEGTSISSLVRRIVAERLARPARPRRDRASAIAGIFEDDLAGRDHDRELYR